MTNHDPVGEILRQYFGDYHDTAYTKAKQDLIKWIRGHNPPPSRVGKDYLEGYYHCKRDLCNEIAKGER